MSTVWYGDSVWWYVRFDYVYHRWMVVGVGKMIVDGSIQLYPEDEFLPPNWSVFTSFQ